MLNETNITNSSSSAPDDDARAGRVSLKPVLTPALALSPHEILLEVCAKHDVDMADLKSRGRRRKWSRARSEACYRLREETDLIWEDIADVMHMSDTSSARWHHKNWPQVKSKPLYVTGYYYYGYGQRVRRPKKA